MRVLLVEDDPLLGDGLEAGLRQSGFNVDWMKDGAAARAAMAAAPYDAVVLDLGLPKVSGLDVLGEWRRQGVDTPVLILTARDSVEDRIRGLDTGADDYLVKPFALGEVVARLRALIRRSHGRANPVFEHGTLVLDPNARTVLQDGRAVELTAKEFQLLELFLENKSRVLPRALLEEKLYGWAQELDSNALEVHVHHLRKKLGSQLIRTVRGVGYLVDKC